MSERRVYSYLRFSTPRQAAGNSAERQIDYARQWAAEHGLVLDDALTMRDEGLSGYHQKHVTKGAFGAFLKAIDDGKVPHGSILIVEGLDRLSRTEPIVAQAQLTQIIMAGITVVTASDRTEYSRERVKTNPTDLLKSLLIMIRAHEESETKSIRVKAALRSKCEAWLAGTYRGRIVGGRDPNWLRWAGDKWELIPERAEVVRLAVQLYAEGLSGKRIFQRLVDMGMDGGLIGVNTNALYRITKREDLIGVRIMKVGDQEYRLEGYYPPLIEMETWAALQSASATRLRRAQKSTIVPILTGLGITRCGYCGESLTGQTCYQNDDLYKRTGQIRESNRRLWCNSRNTPTPCSKGSCSVAPIERAILSYCSDQFRLDTLFAGDDQTQAARARLATLRAGAADIDRKLARITEALLESADAAPLAFARKARELEDERDGLTREIRSLEAELARHANTSKTPALSSAWAALSAAALALDEDARTKVRKLVADTFARIVIWHSGLPTGKTNIDVQLISRSGAVRFLTIDRKSGAWREGMDYTMPQG